MLLIPKLSLANIFGGCGEYIVKGVVRAGPANFAIVVNEKPQSEHLINFPIIESQKLGAYLNRPMTATIVVDVPFNGTVGSSDKIISIDSRIPDPINPTDTGFVLVKKLDCK